MATDTIYKDCVFCISPHQTFLENPTTALTNNWNFIGCGPAVPMPQVERVDVPRYRATRQPHEYDRWVHKYGVPQILTIPEHDVAIPNLRLWMAAFFQKVVDAGTDPYTHTFSPAEHDDAPDFPNDEGYLLHFLMLSPEAGESWMGANGIITQVVIRLGKNDRGNRLTIEPTFLFRDVYPLDDAFSETVDYPAENFLIWNRMAANTTDDSEFLVDADNPELQSFEITMMNTGGGRSQDADGRPISYLLPYFDWSGNLRVLKRALDSDTYINDWLTGVHKLFKCSFVEDTGTYPNDGDFILQLYGKFAEGLGQPEEGDVQEMIYNFPLMGAKDDTYDDMTVVCCDTTATIDSLFT